MVNVFARAVTTVSRSKIIIVITRINKNNNNGNGFQNILTQRSPSPQCHNACLLSFYSPLNTKTTWGPGRVGDRGD